MQVTNKYKALLFLKGHNSMRLSRSMFTIVILAQNMPRISLLHSYTLREMLNVSIRVRRKISKTTSKGIISIFVVCRAGDLICFRSYYKRSEAMAAFWQKQAIAVRVPFVIFKWVLYIHLIRWFIDCLLFIYSSRLKYWQLYS